MRSTPSIHTYAKKKIICRYDSYSHPQKYFSIFFLFPVYKIMTSQTKIIITTDEDLIHQLISNKPKDTHIIIELVSV